MIQAPDLTKSFPRPGREKLGGYVFLGRVVDKVRAMHAGTEGEYLGYCAMSVAFLERSGVSKAAFDELIRSGSDDAAIVAYFDRTVPPEKRDALNASFVKEFADHLDEQDAEEGVAAR